MTSETHVFEIPVADGGVIRGDLRVPSTAGNEAFPIILCVHGFKGFKDWGFYPYFSSEFARRGFVLVKFNFSHNGVGADLENFTELENFKRNSFSKEAADLRAVLNGIQSRVIPGLERADVSRVGILCHSRGIVPSLEVLKGDHQVSALCSLAGVAVLPEVSPEIEAAWRAKGVHFVTNKRTGQQLPLGIELLDQMLARPHRIREDARETATPSLLIHGTADETVPVHELNLLAEWIRNSEKLIINDADHSFGAKHPFVGPSQHLERVLDAAANFFQGTLSVG